MATTPYGVVNSKIITGLPINPPDGTPAELYDLFQLIYRGIQQLQAGVTRYAGIDPEPENVWSSLVYSDTLLESNLTRMYPIASVAIARGQLVNLYNNAGVLNARLAQANSMTTMAHGFANSAATPGGRFEMIWMRANTDSIGGLTVGSQYWLSPTSAGLVQTTKPSVAGQIVQSIGFALTDSIMQIDVNSQPQQL